MSAQTYGAIGDHWFSVAFLFVVYAACVVSVCRMSRRPREREEAPPVGFSPRGRRDVCSVHTLRQRASTAPPREAGARPTSGGS